MAVHVLSLLVMGISAMLSIIGIFLPEDMVGHFALVPFNTLLGEHAIWNLISHAFLETNPALVIFMLAAVTYFASIAEASIRNPLRFIFAICVPLAVSGIIVWIGAVLVYVKSFETDHFYQHMYGCTTLLLVLAVPVLQAIGSDQPMPSPLPVLRRVLSQAPLSSAEGGLDPALPTVPVTPSAIIQVLLLLAAVLHLGTDVSAPLWPSLVALVVSWAHTRFFRPPPKAAQTLPTSEGGSDTNALLRGDRSDGMQFVKLFPAPLRAAVGGVTNPIGGVCLKWRLWNLTVPQRSESERRDDRAAADALFSFSGGSGEGDSSATSGFVGLGAAGYSTAASASGFAGSNTATAAASVRDPVAERRRARALQLLDAKLAQMGGGGAPSTEKGGGDTAAASAKSSGGVGATASAEQSTPTTAAAAAPAATANGNDSGGVAT